MVYMYRYHGSSTVQLSIYSRYILCEDKFGARAPTRGRLTVKMGDTKLQEMPTVVITTMLIGLVLIAIGRKLGWLHTGTPAPPPPTEKWEPKRPSDKDLAVQEARCQIFVTRTLWLPLFSTKIWQCKKRGAKKLKLALSMQQGA